MERNNHALRRWALSLSAVILVCLYPCVFLFSRNAGEANARDMLPFFLLFLATAMLGLAVCGLILRDVGRAGVVTCLGMLAAIHFSMITDALGKILPKYEDKLFLVFVALVLLGLVVLLYRKKPDMTAVCGIIALTFGVLTLMSVIQAVPKLIEAASYGPAPTDRPLRAEEQFTGDRPNVYYLLFDEYGGDENLQFYFSYDNSDFWQALEDRGFSVSHTSRNPESVWTDTLVPNMLNLDYVADDSMPEKVRRVYLEEPLLTRMFQGNGYQVNLINHRAFLRLRGAKELTRGQTEDNISEYLYRQSIYCKLPYIKDYLTVWMFRNYRDNYAGPIQNAIDALEGCAGAASGPTLTISYIQCPHAPFLFHADGSLRNLEQENGWYWKDNTLYPDQLQYINSVILQTVDNIQTQDPTAVILLLSDHGARVSLHMVEQFGGPRFDAARETVVMQNMLLSVYIPGQTLEIEGDTAINATRKTIDAVFGTHLGTIEPKNGYVLDEIYNAKEA